MDTTETNERSLQRQELVDRIADGALRSVNKLIDSGHGVPHSAELLEAIYRECQGVQGFAALVWAQYAESEPGSAKRTRMLETIIRATVHNSAAGGAKKAAAESASATQRAITRQFAPS